LYERAVGFYGSLVHINAYHQPGVEAGKKVATSLLALQRDILAVLRSANEPLPLALLAEKVAASEQIEIVYKIVRHLAANQRGVSLQGSLANPSELTVCYA
jgi:glucose-6-phosphate isomerase